MTTLKVMILLVAIIIGFTIFSLTYLHVNRYQQVGSINGMPVYHNMVSREIIMTIPSRLNTDRVILVKMIQVGSGKF